MNNQLGVHETLDLHEILGFKTICMTKAAAMQGLVSDPQLKQLLQQDVQTGKQHVQQLQSQLSQANLQ